MKFVFIMSVIVALVYATPTPELLEKFEKMMTDCKEKTSVSDEDVGLLMQHKIPESESGKCFAACIKKQLGVLDENNKVNMEKVEGLVSSVKQNDEPKYEAMMKIFKLCAAEVPGGPNECEVSAKLMECCIREFNANNIQFSILSLFS